MPHNISPLLRCTSVLLISGCLNHFGLADTTDWVQFRGTDGQGHAEQTADIPIEFGMEKGVRWRTEIAGLGWSSPVIADGRIWLTTAISEAASPEQQEKRLAGDPMKGIKEVAATINLRAICVDFNSGKILSDVDLTTITNPDAINPLNTYASPTPVIDNGYVFCHFGNYGTWCLDAESGDIVWKTALVVNHSVGPGSSPVIANGKLILVCDGIDQQFVAALDLKTGSEVWKTSRPPMRAQEPEYQKAYCTPVVVDVNGSTQVVIPTAQWVCGYDPETGKELWRADHGDGFSLCCKSVVTDGMVVFTTGYMRPELVAVRMDGSGDVSQSKMAWRVSRGAGSKPSPIAVGEAVYMISDNGVLTKVNSKDGSIAWQERLSGNFSASPISVGGNLLFCSHEGIVTIVKDAEDFQIVARNELEPRILASPAVVGNDLIIRTENALMRIGK